MVLDKEGPSDFSPPPSFLAIALAAHPGRPFGPIWPTYTPHMPSNYPLSPPPRPLRFGSLRYWQRADRKFAKFTKRTLLTCEPKRHHRCWSVGILGPPYHYYRYSGKLLAFSCKLALFARKFRFYCVFSTLFFPGKEPLL